MTFNYKILLVLPISLLIISCSKNHVVSSNNNGEQYKQLVDNNTKNEHYMKNNNISEAIITLSTDFINMYYAPGKNIVISPLSINTALSMAANGAANQTLDEFEDTLGGNITAINKYYNSLINSYTNLTEANIVIADKVYLNNITLKKGYANSIINNLNSEVESIDFGNPKAAEYINSWISKKTNGLIKDMISSLSNAEKMVLINTLYFKSNWFKAFNVHKTIENDFNLSDGKKVKTEFMQSVDTFKYYENNKYESVSIPYENDRFMLTLLLPKDKENMHISHYDLLAVQENTKDHYVDLSLPKFDFEYSIELEEFLETIGLISPFDGSLADFSKLTDDGRLSISAVLHKAKIIVDENGTEAAAATAMILKMSLQIDGKAEKTISFNRPFLFYIWDKEYEIPLFVGVFEKP